jgi:hypothetical protein
MTEDELFVPAIVRERRSGCRGVGSNRGEEAAGEVGWATGVDVRE